MSKTGACITMLQLLKARGFMSGEELANALHCSKRVVMEYKKELEQIGYVIQSSSGKYGGYMLETGPLLPILGFQENEVRSLQEARQYMKSHQDFRMMKDYESAMDKIQATINIHEEESSVYMDMHTRLSKRCLSMIQQCERAKVEERVVRLQYRSLRSQESEQVFVHPYEIVNYKGAYYCLGYSLKAKDYRMFKFSEERMKDCVRTQQNFHRDMNFRLQDHIGKSGLVKDECIELELYIYGETARRMAETTIGIEDKKEWVDEHTLYVTSIMEGKLHVISFLLSLKNQCQLIAPIGLKEEMLEILEDMKSAYSNSSQTLL